MKTSEVLNSGVLLFLLGTVVPTYAQSGQHEQEGNSSPLWKKKQQGGTEKRPQEGNPARVEPQHRTTGQQEQRPPQPSPQANRPQPSPSLRQRAYQPSRQESRGRQSQHQAVWQEHRAQNWQSEHRDWQDRGGYNGYRIPESRYRGHFGPGHTFRVHQYPVGLVGGYANFQYGGFGFSVIDPVPEYWSETWYNDDDVYIDYSGGGYYMHDRRHPTDRIAISVNLR